ncbi:MAG TPA: M14 family zinc carboxypeptidase [Gemmatimonadaceae bacterium]|nr:M14 family zinc carboxypeptidase [Gemmatimonadaceae bacterium]
MRRSITAFLFLTVFGLPGMARIAMAQGLISSDSIRDDRYFSFYARGPYRTQVPSPDSLLGYRVGDMHTQYAWQERVLLAIAAAAPDRVRVEEIGTTTERRTQRLFIISSPENIARLDAIKADLNRLGDPRSLSAGDAESIIARVPAVVWINESVHGSEAAGFEAAMHTMYQLAASDEPATINALRNTLIVLNPSTNPDGHERFAVWYNSIAVGSPEEFSLEYGQPWSIQGRFNHYRFDMNRDVMTTTQREARNLLMAAMRWNPMVTIDQHGYTYSFFFPPTAAPMNANVGPDFQKWMEIFGRANASAFDRYGWMYYSRDVFDFYGPFYWDLWPSLTGAIGMTYETDCTWAVRTRREDGTLCTFRGAVGKHFVSALATIEATAARRAERVRDWVKFRREAVDEGRTSRLKRVVLVPSDPGLTLQLVATLLRSGIEVRRASESFSSTRAHAYADDAVAARRFEAGAFVIDLAQPLGRAARAVLEPSASLDSAFARTQIERFQRNLRRGANVPGEGYEFYDVTAWSLPVVFGADAYWTEDATPVNGPLVRLRDAAVAGVVSGARPARSAYVFTADRNNAAQLAFRLLTNGVRVGMSDRPIEAGGRNFPRGTYVVRVGRNDTTVHTLVQRFARETGVDVFGANTAFSERAQFGVGSGSVTDLRVPSVALVGEEGVSQTSYGAAWYVLEQRYGLPFTPVRASWLAGGDLSRFNVIIIPDASSGTLNRLLGDGGANRVRDWVRGGGTLITFGGASAWAARDNVNLTSARMVGSEAKPDSGAAASRADTSAAARRRAEEDLLAVTSPSATSGRPVSLPGSHFDVVLDRTHWLTSGYSAQRLTALMDGSSFFTLSKEGANVAVFPRTGRLHRAGFVWPENTERLLRNSALLIDEPTGGGHVVLFANEPWFRAWWHALDRLVLNAIVLGPSF